MRIANISLIASILCFGASEAASAREMMLLADQQQKCTSNAECILVSQTCETSCASLPINAKFQQMFTDRRAQNCGAAIQDLPACHMNPPLGAVCMNQRCTIDYAFQHSSHDGDYRNGGYQGPAKP